MVRRRATPVPEQVADRSRRNHRTLRRTRDRLGMHPSDRGTLDHSRRGVFLAIVAATLFGISAPFSKLLLRDASPQLFAGILYLGSGVGLSLLWLARRTRGRATNPLTRRDAPWLV